MLDFKSVYFCYHINIYKKDAIVIFFEIKPYFYWSFKLDLDPSNSLGHVEVAPVWFSWNSGQAGGK